MIRDLLINIYVVVSIGVMIYFLISMIWFDIQQRKADKELEQAKQQMFEHIDEARELDAKHEQDKEK